MRRISFLSLHKSLLKITEHPLAKNGPMFLSKVRLVLVSSKSTAEVKEILVFNDPDSIRVALEEIIRTEWKTLADKPYIPEIDFVRHLASNIKVNVVEQMEKVLQSFSVNCSINGEKTTVDATVGFNGKEYEFTMTFP